MKATYNSILGKWSFFDDGYEGISYVEVVTSRHATLIPHASVYIPAESSRLKPDMFFLNYWTYPHAAKTLIESGAILPTNISLDLGEGKALVAYQIVQKGAEDASS